MNFSINNNQIRFISNHIFEKKKIIKLGDSSFQIIIGKNTCFYSNSIIYYDNTIGSNNFIGHNTLIRNSNKIGNDVKIGSNTEIAFNCIIKDSVKIHSNCFICEDSYIGKNVFLGPNVTFTNSKYPNKANSKQHLKSPIIEKNTVIGACSIIMPGIKIGSNVIIGAGSLVSKDIASNKTFFNKRIDNYY